MEQHAVPQNVTTFQFRLVGDMTIKQFGYLSSGIIVGYLCYKLPLPFFFTWPLAISSGLLGFGLAFVPVEERPMDVWIASFFKNVYSPTRWVWQKEKRMHAPPTAASASQPAPHSAPAVRRELPLAWAVNALASLLASILPAQKPPSAAPKGAPEPAVRRDAQKPQPAPSPPGGRATAPLVGGAIFAMRHTTGPLDWLKSLFRSATKKPPVPALTPELSFTEALAAQSAPSVTGTRPNITESQKPVPAPPPPPAGGPAEAPAPPPPPTAHAVAHERIVELQTQLSDALSQRERLEKELITIRQRLDNRASPQTQPTRQATMAPQPAPMTPTASVRVIAPETAARAGLPRLTTFPNVVTGIVKDHYGNLLTGMLVTVRDKDDVPLRALKTNRLGQFAASTPLPNGTYLVEIEDPKGAFIFDKAQLPLAGAIAPLIEVIAKSQRRVERDKLAREIFGSQQDEFTITKSQ